ncbi:MAG: LysM peptidoglycan-binding domain-containing protein [Chloroflexota bacterium]|jgi:LysM repeat protein
MRFILPLCVLVVFLTACAPQPTFSTSPPLTLLPYRTSTPAAPPWTPPSLVAAETPLPTPTPFPYTVQQGETISSIALKFGVSIDELLAANPDVNPNVMSIGAVLQIPSRPQNLSGEATPTPAPFIVEQIACHPTANRGMWCFVLAHNDSPDFMENLSAQVTLVDSSGAPIAAQTALLPLNILPPNSSLPLTAYFPPEIPLDAEPRVQVLTAIRLLPGDSRYLPATLHDTLVEVGAGGHFANVSGEVRLPAESLAAAQVWVAAVAYDEQGRVVGVRRWEGGGIQPGGSLRFEMTVSSLGGVVTRVEFAAEARP